MEPVQLWGFALMAASTASVAFGRGGADDTAEPRLPDRISAGEALMASIGMYGFFMAGVLLAFWPLMADAAKIAN